MDISKLGFNADEMLNGLEKWVLCESPTYDPIAVNRMQDIAAHEMGLMGASIKRLKLNSLAGDCVKAQFPHPNLGQPGILIIGHMDTVHPIGTLEYLPFKREENICYGPGICDMKGGNYLALEAIRQLQKNGIETPLPISVLFTSDEEIGSPYTRQLIEFEAAQAKVVLVPEPARRNNGLVSGRYAIARYDVTTSGRPSHAGSKLEEGRSAIKQMAKNILNIEAMTTKECTFSVGVMEAGEWVNCVPANAREEVLSMAKDQQDLDRGIRKMLALNDDNADVKTNVKVASTRPVWEANAATMKLVEITKVLAKALGTTSCHQSSGGGSDGNFTGAMGIPTLDGLGVAGDKYHTLEEYIEIQSLSMRGKLMAGLLMAIEKSF